jgi:alpha-galactosidase
MGYSNWYDTKCDVHASRFLEAADALERTGLRALGYTQLNIDAGAFLPNRTNGKLVPDPRFFPNGFTSLAAELGARGFSLGGYTDRGVKQCGPSPGSKGFEISDAAQFVAWNMTYVKVDDCYSSLDYATGMADFKLFGDALRRGNPDIYYLICGCKLGEGRPAGWAQCPRDASQFASAWRVASDDYTWKNVLLNANINAGLSQFQSAGHWNDPDMLINTPLVPGGWPSAAVCPNLEAWKTVRSRGFPSYSISPKQARLQFALWSIMSAPLILSLNVRKLSKYDLDTYGNRDVISIDQDSLALQGTRLSGFNLTTGYVPPAPTPPGPSPTPPNGTKVIKNYNIVRRQCDACAASHTGCCINATVPNPTVQYLSHKKSATLQSCVDLCASFHEQSSNCHSFVWNSANHDCFGRLDSVFDQNNSKYADSPGIYSGTLVSRAGRGEKVPPPLLAMHDGGVMEKLSHTNVWGKKLNDSGFALLFLNVGPTPTPVTCNSSCIARLGVDAAPGRRFRVRDVWAHEDLPEMVAPLVVTSPPLGGEDIYNLRFYPLAAR